MAAFVRLLAEDDRECHRWTNIARHTIPTWTSSELDTFADEDELSVASLRSDDTLTHPRTVWVVRYGDDLYIRSVNGPTAGWYVSARARDEGRVISGGTEKDVNFVDATVLNDEIDGAYRAKYRRYPRNVIDTITSNQARGTTLRLTPRERSITRGAKRLGRSVGPQRNHDERSREPRLDQH
jgi:hypothetical protein